MAWTVAVLKLSFDAYPASTTLWLAASTAMVSYCPLVCRACQYHDSSFSTDPCLI